MHTARAGLLACALLTACLGLGAPSALAGQTPAPSRRYPTAHCSDGTYYYGRSRSKACAHHRGVAEWLAPPPRATPPHSRTASRRPAARAPAGATARCKDGTYSFLRRRAAACARHGGIARWLLPR